MAPQHRPACRARPAAHPFLLCTLDLGHEGPHTAWHNWRDDDDETPTVQFPPIGSTTRRRPPVPAARVVELTDRVELLQALGRELQRELAELRDDEDLDDDEDDDRRPCAACGHRADLHLVHPFPGTSRRCTGIDCPCTGFVAR